MYRVLYTIVCDTDEFTFCVKSTMLDVTVAYKSKRRALIHMSHPTRVADISMPPVLVAVHNIPTAKNIDILFL